MGGLIGALLSGIVAARFTGIPYLTLADMGRIAAPIGLFFGRCANFVNGELWAPTSLPWGVVFGGTAGAMPRHPSQLYEALLEGVVLFCVLYVMSRKQPPRPQGTFLGVFLMGYGLFRFLIEFVRQPDAQIGYLMGRMADHWARSSAFRSWWRGACRPCLCRSHEETAKRASRNGIKRVTYKTRYKRAQGM